MFDTSFVGIDAVPLGSCRAIADKKGLHSGKEFPLPRIGDASEVRPGSNVSEGLLTFYGYLP